MPDRWLPVSPRLGLAVLLSFPFLPGCGRSPVAPAASSFPSLSGYVYEVMLPGAGEPPIADVLITVTGEDGEAASSRTDDAGFYTVRAESGTVLVTASKEGYKTRQSRFEMTDSTVLNFSLKPAD